jgi:FkbM family methyltransferase
MDLLTRFKKIVRPLYYLWWNNRVVIMESPPLMKGLKWIVNNRFGRAYFKGYYEPDIVKFLINNVKANDCFLDVGGHAGYFSYLFSRINPSGYVFTFEPDTQNADFIRKIISLNDIKNIELINKGAGSKSGDLFFTPGSNSSTGKISEAGSIRVPVIALDDFLKDRVLSSNLFMKIDVEGFGGEVIKGAMQTITNYHPTILMELHDHSNEREVLGSLSSLGYSFFSLQQLPESIINRHCRFYLATIEQKMG